MSPLDRVCILCQEGGSSLQDCEIRIERAECRVIGPHDRGDRFVEAPGQLGAQWHHQLRIDLPQSQQYVSQLENDGGQVFSPGDPG
jgi:hypothetical protein